MRDVMIECDEDSPLGDGPWLLQPTLDSVHILFEAEANRHELDRGCWCAPDVEIRDPVTQRDHTKPIVIHRRVPSGDA